MNSIPSNPILDQLPKHLKQYIIPQNYDDYTPINQAVWRYVMKKNVAILSKVAHESYVEGLKKTGVSLESIPDMYGMNRILKDIGWAAAAVDGFIPPSAFMEFQAYNVLVIAVDIRTLEHIEYTPAPDIIHEAAGHAPIIANPEYAEYLRRLGEIGSKAIASKHDWQMYHAVRKLSQLKEVDEPDQEAIDLAQAEVDRLQNLDVPLSEMAKIRNLQWWTVEYGLIGSPKDFKIYGAGLLSSIGESEWCLKPEIEKLPYDISAAEIEFDITRPQPQLFVTPNFAHLSKVLEQFANQLSVRKGGMEGIQKLIESKSLGTIELSTGLQISGVFTDFKAHNGRVCLVRTEGQTALAFHEKELIGHSISRYENGFISPVGRLKDINIAIEDMSPRDLEAYEIYEGRDLILEFEGNVRLEGKVVTGTRNLKGKIMVITLDKGAVYVDDEAVFVFDEQPFHLAVGKDIVSAFAGPADHPSFDLLDHQLSPSSKNKHKSESRRAKEDAYRRIREMRTRGDIDPKVLDRLISSYQSEWLLLLEIYEITLSGPKLLNDKAKTLLHAVMEKDVAVSHLVESGISIYGTKVLS